MRARFLIGLGLQGAAVALLLAALALEHSAFFQQQAVTIGYLVAFSGCGLVGLGLMWSDVAKKPVRWAVSVLFTLVWAGYHLILSRGRW